MFGIEDFTKKIVDFENFNPSQFSDALLFGGAILLIGMLTIFAVLALLWICLTIFKVIMEKKSGKKAEKSTAATVQTPSPREKSAEDEIVAVIAAAIAAAESESSGTKFKVVSFKRR